MSKALAKFIECLKEWKKFVYGHITTCKRKLLHQLTDIRQRMDFFGSNRLAQSEIRVRHELKNVLHHVEIL